MKMGYAPDLSVFLQLAPSLLDAATVAKKVNFPHPHANRGPAGNSLTMQVHLISPNGADCRGARTAVEWRARGEAKEERPCVS